MDDTPSLITVKHSDGKYHTAYCHWDGYPSHNGVILRDHYNSQERAEALIALGDMSSLAPSIEKPKGHTFDSPVKGYTTFYGRDRGEEDVGAKISETLEDALNIDMGQEYHYVFEDGEWTVFEDGFGGDTGPRVSLTEAIEQDS